jgi:asparagine synthase (glutamine-hydrolysing)
MCGIVGIVDYQQSVHLATIKAMCQAIEHRGPDHSGCYIDQNSTFAVGLGSQRLSIVDLSAAGNQPITNETEDIWIVYNGELYNHIELRRELEARGHHYRSHADTETIVHAYEEYGTACLQRLNGMFAFALYDTRRQLVILARDPMGIKPLYYTWDGNRLIFGSELRGLFAATNNVPAVNPTALSLYLSLGYIPSPHCIFNGIHKLPPGASLVIENKQLRIDLFWTPQIQETSTVNLEPAALVETTRSVIEDAVIRQLMSDVPVGVFLSGGLDSSIITVLAQRHHSALMDTFSVGFADAQGELDSDDLYNQDLVHAREVAHALGTRHHEVIVPTDGGIADLLQATLTHIDEPVWESSFVSLHLMSKLARQHGVIVVLTGDGGDELFAGYPWYFSAQRFQRYQKVPFMRLALPLLSTIGGKGTLGVKARDLQQRLVQDDMGRYRINYDIFSEQEKGELLTPEILAGLAIDPVNHHVRELLSDSGADTLLEKLAVADLALWVREHFNQRVDRMSMMNSVEARVPLQDMKVVEFALGVPMPLKMRNGKSKYLLREAFQADLPSAVLKRPKRPFATPAWTWLRKPLRVFVMDMLSADSVRAVGLLNPEAVQHIVTKFMNGDDRLAFKVWTLLNLHVWYHSAPTTAQRLDSATAKGRLLDDR